MENTKEKIENLDPSERRDFLETHADAVEETEYFKMFDEEELQQTQADLSDAAIKLSAKEEELKEIKDRFKVENSELLKMFKNSLSNLKSRGERIKGRLYLFADQENKMMHYFDASGQLVQSRRLRPEERQMGILSINKSAANG